MFSCFTLNVYLPQNIDMSLFQDQWYSQNLEKTKTKTKTRTKNKNKNKKKSVGVHSLNTKA